MAGTKEKQMEVAQNHSPLEISICYDHKECKISGFSDSVDIFGFKTGISSDISGMFATSWAPC